MQTTYPLTCNNFIRSTFQLLGSAILRTQPPDGHGQSSHFHDRPWFPISVQYKLTLHVELNRVLGKFWSADKKIGSGFRMEMTSLLPDPNFIQIIHSTFLYLVHFESFSTVLIWLEIWHQGAKTEVVGNLSAKIQFHIHATPKWFFLDPRHVVSIQCTFKFNQPTTSIKRL